MYKFSKSSLEKLKTCDIRLQEVFSEVLNYADITIVYGYRSITEQMELYKKGRELVEGRWVVKDKNGIVTYCDGIYTRSKHNNFPATAIDVAPYPIDWTNTQRFNELSEVVKNIISKKNIPLVWGGDFKSIKDYPHWELNFKNDK